jgi:hypothetical protein
MNRRQNQFGFKFFLVLSMLGLLCLPSVITTVYGATDGYTYRNMERRKKTKVKNWKKKTIGSKKYRQWERGFIVRIRCLSVDPNTTNEQLRLACFQELPKPKSQTETTQ